MYSTFISRIAIILVLLLIVAYAVIGYQNSTPPPLGHTNGQLSPVPTTPNAVSSQSQDPRYQVSTLPFYQNQEQTMAALLLAVQLYDNATIELQQTDYLYVVFTTPVLGFHDDAEFYLDSASQSVHFRSASRAGYSDGGLNRARYEALRQHYLAAIKTTTAEAQSIPVKPQNAPADSPAPD